MALKPDRVSGGSREAIAGASAGERVINMASGDANQLADPAFTSAKGRSRSAFQNFTCSFTNFESASGRLVIIFLYVIGRIFLYRLPIGRPNEAAFCVMHSYYRFPRKVGVAILRLRCDLEGRALSRPKYRPTRGQ